VPTPSDDEPAPVSLLVVSVGSVVRVVTPPPSELEPPDTLTVVSALPSLVDTPLVAEAVTPGPPSAEVVSVPAEGDTHSPDALPARSP
jgi:hypothetical protein